MTDAEKALALSMVAMTGIVALFATSKDKSGLLTCFDGAAEAWIAAGPEDLLTEEAYALLTSELERLRMLLQPAPE